MNDDLKNSKKNENIDKNEKKSLVPLYVNPTLEDEIVDTNIKINADIDINVDIETDDIETDELKKIFKKMELESEIDKLREDASEKKYHLDELYLKAKEESSYNNDESFVLALFFKEGFNKEIDLKESIKLLKKLVDIGYLPAMIELGEIYLYGLYNDYKSSLEAEKYFKKATKYGLLNPLTFYEKRAYAKALIFGYEIEKDRMKAFELLKDKQEHPFNESLLGHIFYDDSISIFNKERAISHWLVAKENRENSFLKFLKENNIDLNVDNNKMIDSIW
jgi:hypothetical protein